MPVNETIFAFSSPKAGGKTAPPPRPVTAAELKEKSLVLDMGEASREQGFRLYGCR
jgi:hypothetical protein